MIDHEAPTMVKHQRLKCLQMLNSIKELHNARTRGESTDSYILSEFTTEQLGVISEFVQSFSYSLATIDEERPLAHDHPDHLNHRSRQAGA